jgi:hypothetical protein
VRAAVELVARHRGAGPLAAIIVLTRSRAAWLAALVALGVAALAAWRAGPRSAPGAFCSAPRGRSAGALVLPNRLAWNTRTPYRDSLTGLMNYQDGSGRGRLIQYGNTLELVQRNPVFGTGPGNWMVEYPLVATPGDPSFAGADPIPTNPWPSSDWIANLAERGVIGTLLLGAAFIAAGLIALRRLRQENQRVAAAGTLTLLAATLVWGCSTRCCSWRHPAVVFAALGALLPDTGNVVTRELTGGAGLAIGLPLRLSGLLVLHSGPSWRRRITEIGGSVSDGTGGEVDRGTTGCISCSACTCTPATPRPRGAAQLPHRVAREWSRLCEDLGPGT